MNASIQIKTHSVQSVRNKNTHILRNSGGYQNPRIIILQQPQNRFSKPTKEKPAKAVLKNEAERKKELNTVNSNIRTYQNRIDVLLPKDEQDELKKRKELIKALKKQSEALKGDERKRLKEIIKDEEKSLETIRDGFLKALPITLKTRVLKLQEKLRKLFEKREEFKEAKEVPETRGKKQEHYYVEFIMSITNSNEYRNNDEFIATFEELQNEFLNIKFCEDLEVWTNAIHLDQHSVHSHIMLKIPEGQTWTKHLQKFEKNDGRELYKLLAKHWHSLVKNKLSEQFQIELENQTSGQRYISLRNYKKQKPIQILEKVEKINSRPNMSGISSHLRSLVERVEKTHAEVQSFSKSKSTQSESSSREQDTEAQPSSNPQSPKPQKRAKR